MDCICGPPPTVNEYLSAPHPVLSEVIDMASTLPELTLRRYCAGRCGAWIAYIFEPGSFAPALRCDGLVAYKDGHLCPACESTVEASLAARRLSIAAAEFSDRKGPAT